MTVSVLTAIFPDEPGLASFIEAKDDIPVFGMSSPGDETHCLAMR